VNESVKRTKFIVENVSSTLISLSYGSLWTFH